MVKAVVGEEAGLTSAEDRFSHSAIPAEVGLVIGKLSSVLDCGFVFERACSVRPTKKSGCLTNVVHPNITLLEVFLHTRELRTQIEALANICDLYDISLSYCVSPWECLFTEATTQFHGFYKGSDLLTYLYSQLKVADPAHSAMVKFLFLKTCEPYCEFIRSWIYKAELNDPHKEFIVECITESTSFSWNTAGISRLKRAREQEGGLVPCFLDGFLEPILRAGQQLQVITKLLELCNLSASGLRNYADLLPYWTHYSSSSLVYPSPITFSKLHIEVMIQKRDDYYRRMQEKLCDLSRKFELFLGQVPGATSLPISFGDGERLEKSSGNFTQDESLLVPSTVAMDLARDQSGSESDDQKTEDRWFSEIDASCSSESSSTRDFSESDVGMLDFQSTLAGPLPNYLSALRFSVASAGKCDENLAQHGESGYIDNNFVTKDEKADTHRQWMDIEPEESTEACEVDKFRGLLSIKSWPLGGLPRNPFIVDKHAEDDKQYPPTDSGDKMEQRGSMNTDESTLLLNNIPTGISCLKQERKHDLLENCSSSKLYLLKETKVNYPYEVLSMNPMLRCDFLRKNGNINRRDQAKLLPWFDFSAVDNPSKTCLARIPVGFRVDDSLEYHSSQTDRKSHFHANQECGIDSPDVEDPKVSCSHLSSGFKGRAEENKSNVPGGSRWEGMLLRSNNPETSALSDCRQSSSPTFELPLDFVIDKCLLQEILLQHQVNHFVSTLQQYVHSELSHVSWSKFLHSLKNKSALSRTSVKIAYWYWFNIIFLATLKPVKDMMDLESVHMVYLSEALSITYYNALDFRSCLPQGTGRVPNDSWTNTLGIDTCQVMMVKQKFEKEMKDLYMCHRRSPKHGRFGLSRFWDCLNFNLYYSEILHDSNIFPLIP
ncbi:hypothetical protein F2Q70_00011874 [Brassica cretica]|uniref:Gamma-tubulin complex component n=1 Tax=Brassica cretica TaxID=69181 RepID=A0A8S9LWG3_BRACR|nr:hypothetical protein F2Q70_00011874 [Brassica cretica]